MKKKRSSYMVAAYATVPMTAALWLCYIAAQQAWGLFAWLRVAGLFIADNVQYILVTIFMMVCVFGACLLLRWVVLSWLSDKECKRRGGEGYYWATDCCWTTRKNTTFEVLWDEGDGRAPYK